MNVEKCSSCSKEKQDRIPVRRMIEKLDECFSRNDLAGAKRMLEYWDREAVALGDSAGRLAILNEQIGLYRRTEEETPALNAIADALKIIDCENISKGPSLGTIYVNIATTLKAFGKAETAIEYYDKATEIYNSNTGVPHFEKAALKNNLASALTELREFAAAEERYQEAIALLENDGEFYGEVAVTYVNLAHLYEDSGRDKKEISDAMETAFTYLNKPNIPHDGNYAFICSKCAPSFAYFGYEDIANQLATESEKIYAGN